MCKETQVTPTKKRGGIRSKLEMMRFRPEKKKGAPVGTSQVSPSAENVETKKETPDIFPGPCEFMSVMAHILVEDMNYCCCNGKDADIAKNDPGSLVTGRDNEEENTLTESIQAAGSNKRKGSDNKSQQPVQRRVRKRSSDKNQKKRNRFRSLFSSHGRLNRS